MFGCACRGYEGQQYLFYRRSVNVPANSAVNAKKELGLVTPETSNERLMHQRLAASSILYPECCAVNGTPVKRFTADHVESPKHVGLPEIGCVLAQCIISYN